MIVSCSDLRLQGNMRHVLPFTTIVLLALVGNPLLRGAAAGQPPLFATEQSAQPHCPADIVVWLNLPSGIYRFMG